MEELGVSYTSDQVLSSVSPTNVVRKISKVVMLTESQENQATFMSGIE